MRRIALLFAGQGAQAVGMGKDLVEAFPSAREYFEKADEILGFPMSRIAFEGPMEELTKTSVAQPALYVHAYAAYRVLWEHVQPQQVVATAGLSLGEFTAHAAAGTFDFEEGLRLVAQRSQFMQEACEQTNGGMAALIGGDEASVRSLAAAADVDVANFNSPGQIVLSGDQTKIALAVGMAKDYGIRKAIELSVAGAFHSRLMDSAYQKLSKVLEETPIVKPQIPVIGNVDALPTVEPADIRRALADQVTGSVLWTNTMEYLLDHLHCDLFLEFGPGGILSGLMQRTRKGTEIHSVSTVEDVRKLGALLS